MVREKDEYSQETALRIAKAQQLANTEIDKKTRRFHSLPSLLAGAI